MAPYILWFLLALGMLMAEMASGTFYMLVLSLAMCIGGGAALLGVNEPGQLTLAGLAGIAGIVMLRRWRGEHPDAEDVANPDIGNAVQVSAWHEDGTARVHYRGAEWDAEPESADTPHTGTLYIKEMHGSTLILSQHKPHNS